MLITGPEICHVDRCPHGCTSETGCKGIEVRRLRDEAARAAFEQDAKQRDGGAYDMVNLRASRTASGYMNPSWTADWKLWLRAWNAALGVPTERKRADGEPAAHHPEGGQRADQA